MLTLERNAVGIVKAQPGKDLHLLAGQLFFGRGAFRVKTLLGSCVAVTLWHPQKKVGGMCHFLLPQRERKVSDQALDGRFGEEAVELLVRALKAVGTKPSEFEAHLYGGADTMPDRVGVKFNVGERNIELGWSLIDHYGFALQGVDVGDFVPRNVELSLETGEVNMRRGQPAKQSKQNK